MKVVIALGGNALLKRGERLESDVQRQNVAHAAAAVAAIARQHRVIVTHGNGPQVGLLAMQAESYAGLRPYPLDVLGAETEDMIGYLIENAGAILLGQRGTRVRRPESTLDFTGKPNSVLDFEPPEELPKS
jgi:carbamate kinase